MSLDLDAGVSSPVVLVTGAAGGLGRALVEAFRADGWRVAAAGHRTAPEVGDCGNSLGILFDVRDRESVRAGVGCVLERWGRIDVLVNNAGVLRDGLLACTTDADWDLVLGTHLKGAFHCAQAVLPTMERQGSGHILSIGSWAGRVGAAGQSAYAAAKAGLMGWTLALAREVGGLGIRVNLVLPGVLPTAMTAGLSEARLEAFAAANVLGRINDPRTVARQVVQLAAATDVSGQVFSLDSRVGRWA